ncbi:MAG: glycosyltransferase family 9 protein [Phycisphaerales bacterium]|nr:glycosyltransferase family 9 protein [Phycisphaerales bacterium]
MSGPLPALDWPALQRLLIIMPSWVGDATMATPLLRALRSDAQSCHLRLIGYMRPGLDELIDGSGLLDEMIVGRPEGATGPWREGRRLATARCDAAILLPNSWRLAATARLASIPIRIGYNREARGWMLTHPLPSPAPGGWKQPIPAIDYYLSIGRSLGIAADDRRMSLRASAEQQRVAEAILERAGVADGAGYAVLNPGASKSAKRWPADRFAKLADHLAQHHHLRVLVSGSPRERDLIESICRSATSRPFDLVEANIALGPLKYVASRARLLVTNDTGTRHIAAACAMEAQDSGTTNAPPLAIVSLFGPTDPRWAQIEYPPEKQISTGGEPITEIALDLVCRASDEVLAAPD